MAKVRCQYCDELIDDTSAFCPHCNAANKDHKRFLKDIPKDITSLSQWVKNQKLPENSTMSFIVGPPSSRKNSYVLNKDGKNINIYYVDREGKKQMKYHGADEEYACGLFYQMVRDESIKATINATQLTSENITKMMQLTPKQKLANQITPFLWSVFKFSSVILAFVFILQTLR